MINIVRVGTDVDNAQRRRFTMNRRSTLMLAIGGVAGIAFPTAAAEFHKKKGSGRTPTSTPSGVGGARDMRIGSAPQFQDLKEIGPDRQVVTIRYNRDTYKITTADGQSADFSETNLRFKIDSSHAGPLAGRPVILPTGMMGDRVTVFFASPAEMSALIKHQG
jgi:cytochrome c